MKISQIKKGLVLITIASGTLAIGCELIVDFDRTKIPVDTAEASVPVDGSVDTEAGDDAAADQETPDAADAAAEAEAAADADADADQ